MSLPRGRRAAQAFAPEWLIEVVRPRPAPVPWAAMLRAALEITAPLAVGAAVGRLVPGLLASMGGLLVAIVDRAGPYPARMRRIVTCALAGGVVGLIVGELIHGHAWLAVPVVMLLAGVSALVSAISAVWSLAGLQLLVYASLGLGPLGAIRPWWLPPAMLLVGVVWGIALIVPGWLAFPRVGEERAVAAVYRALAGKARAIGTPAFPDERRAVTAALNAAYDQFLTSRTSASGRDRGQIRLVALLNQAQLVAQATTALGQTGQRPAHALVTALDEVADAVGGGHPAPAVPPAPAQASPGLLTLWDGVLGAVDLLAGARPAPQTWPAPGGRSLWAWVGALPERLRRAGTVRTFAVRLMLCMGVAAVVGEALPLQRSYWVVLTVAIVLKPDFGSVFARALQRGVGTVIGAAAGIAVVALIPYGPWLLAPVAVFAALLPYGRDRNYGLFSVFVTPLVVLLIDLLVGSGAGLAQARLIDTLIGCAIVLVIGYAPWPGAWHADLPRRFADAVGDVARYLPAALSGAPAVGLPALGAPAPSERTRLRRRAYRALSDVAAEFQRTMAEPAPISRRATAWWPALIALERVMDTATALAVAIDHGAAPPAPDAVEALAGQLREVAEGARSGRPPVLTIAVGSAAPGGLAPVTEAVRGVLAALGSLAPGDAPNSSSPPAPPSSSYSSDPPGAPGG